MIVVRSLGDADYEAVHALNIAIEREYVGDAVWYARSAAEQDDSLVTNPEEFAACVETGFSLVAVEGDTVVGFLLAFREPLPRTRLYVWQVSVAATHRRSGAALSMYQELIERAKAAGIADIRANIDLDNDASMRLHERAGFTPRQRMQATLRL